MEEIAIILRQSSKHLPCTTKLLHGDGCYNIEGVVTSLKSRTLFWALQTPHTISSSWLLSMCIMHVFFFVFFISCARFYFYTYQDTDFRCNLTLVLSIIALSRYQTSSIDFLCSKVKRALDREVSTVLHGVVL